MTRGAGARATAFGTQHLRTFASAVILAVLALGGCATGVPDFPRTPSYTLDDPAESTLLAQARAAAQRHPGQSGFMLLDRGTDAFAARALATLRAERTLDIQYYLVHDGVTTRLLMDFALAAADRGVRVRILLDDQNSRGNDFAVATLSAHPNIDVRLFNPMVAGRDSPVSRTLAMATNLNRLHRRMHNKLWVVDNAVAITGGRNLGDEYFGASGTFNFADLDLLATGPVVTQLSHSFDDYWNSPNAVPVEAFVTTRPGDRELRRLRAKLANYVARDRVQASPYIARLKERSEDEALSFGDDALSWGEGAALWDDPAKVNAPGIPPPSQTLINTLQPVFDGVQHDLDIVSAYFMPGDDGVAALAGLASRGVDVRVLTNSLQATDVPFVFGAYRGYRPALLEAGIGLHELKPSLRERTAKRRWGLWGSRRVSLHTKAFVFDDDTAFVGSFNLDPRSRYWDTEVGVLVKSADFAARLRDSLRVGFEPGNSYRLERRDGTLVYRDADEHGPHETRWPYASPWRHFQSWLADTFGPDGMM